MSNDLENRVKELENALTQLRDTLKTALTYLNKQIEKHTSFNETDQPQKKIIRVSINKHRSIIYELPERSNQNGVSIYIDRTERIEWQCEHPFTICYGANSPITHKNYGEPSPNGITPFIIAKKDSTDGLYKTKPTWIGRNTLDGHYKYVVVVHHPDGDVFDDPETIVPPPRGGGMG